MAGWLGQSIKDLSLFTSPLAARVILSVFVFSVISILPLAYWQFGGDIMFQYVAIECFATQFWQGDLYPHWCYDANAGLGAPVFIYYFPLPFYVASLFYPLTWIGGSVDQVYLLCLWLATFVTGLTAWHWLRDIVPARLAIILALIYLWMPYRLELMMFRSAYSELWCLAWMPLVCKYTRRLAQAESAALPKLALAFCLCFISNMPAAVIGVLMSAAYSAMMVTGATRILLLRWLTALLWGGMLAAFYLGPAILYKPYVTTEGVIGGKRSWSNDFLSMANVTEHGQGNVVVAIGLTLCAVAAMIAYGYWRRPRLGDGFMRREVRAWAVVALVAMVMIFPVSRPLWQMLGFISMLAFPWRMQLIVMLAGVYFAALILGRLFQPGRPAFRGGDMSLIFGMLALLGLFVISARSPDFVTYGDKIIASRFVTQREYRSIWTDKPYIAMRYVLDRYDNRGRIPHVQVISGKAHAEAVQWEGGSRVLDVDARNDAVLRTGLQYFPVWQVKSVPEQAIEMKPEDKTGQLLLLVPPGHYQITLVTSIFTLSAVKISAFMLASLCAWLAWVGLHYARPGSK